jgi:hypothetical protein
MYPAAFSIVSVDDPGQVFAVGLEIVQEGAESDTAITYRCGPGEGKAMIGQHRSAHDALRLFNRIVPVKLIWAHDELMSALSEE